jgi:hypothetical protein
VSLYEHMPHPHIAHRSAHGPIKVVDQLDTSNPMARFNTKLAIIITKLVGSMWCAYAFGVFDLISLPDAINSGTAAIISWIAQTFLQLVLLSVIMVGQNVQAEAADKRSEATYKDTEALLHGQEQVAVHLALQDMVLRAMVAKFNLECQLPPVPDAHANAGAGAAAAAPTTAAATALAANSDGGAAASPAL